MHKIFTCHTISETWHKHQNHTPNLQNHKLILGLWLYILYWQYCIHNHKCLQYNNKSSVSILLSFTVNFLTSLCQLLSTLNVHRSSWNKRFKFWITVCMIYPKIKYYGRGVCNVRQMLAFEMCLWYFKCCDSLCQPGLIKLRTSVHFHFLRDMRHFTFCVQFLDLSVQFWNKEAMCVL